jgi:hypothetical protein
MAPEGEAPLTAKTYQERGPHSSYDELLPPPRLLVSDLGMRPTPQDGNAEFLTWDRVVHTVDVHLGYAQAELYYTGRGYAVTRRWQDAEGVWVNRWERIYTRRELDPIRRRERERKAARRAELARDRLAAKAGRP